MELLNGARETTATTGTGTLTFGGAVTGRKTFAGAGAVDGGIYPYGIQDGANEEIGWGLYSSTGPTLTRNVLRSTNSDAAISLSGAAQVFCTAPAEIFQGSRRNLILNPGMEIDQENEGDAVTTTNGIIRPVDGWVVTALQSASPATIGGVRVGDVLGADTRTIHALETYNSGTHTAGTNDVWVMQQAIEGLDFCEARWGTASALPLVLAFSINCNFAGTIGVAVRNGAANRSFVRTLAVAANTTKNGVLVFPGDTSGTWLTTNGVGAFLSFCMGAGSAFQGTADAWQASNIVTTSAQTQAWATNMQAMYLSGVELYANRFPLLNCRRRSVAEELLLCQRHYGKTYDQGIKPGTVTRVGEHLMLVGVTAIADNSGLVAEYPPMRDVPAVTLFSPGSGAAGKSRNYNTAADLDATVSQPGRKGFTWYSASPAASAVKLAVHHTRDARLI